MGLSADTSTRRRKHIPVGSAAASMLPKLVAASTLGQSKKVINFIDPLLDSNSILVIPAMLVGGNPAPLPYDHFLKA